MELEVGDVVTLKLPTLGNKERTLGVVYAIYDDFDIHGKMGASIIFENGEYDGFGYDDQEFFLNKEHSPIKILYTFTNVMQLSKDFEKGYWNGVLKK